MRTRGAAQGSCRNGTGEGSTSACTSHDFRHIQRFKVVRGLAAPPRSEQRARNLIPCAASPTANAPPQGELPETGHSNYGQDPADAGGGQMPVPGGPGNTPGLGSLLLVFLGGHLRGRPGRHHPLHARVGNGLPEMLVNVRQEDHQDTPRGHLLPEEIHLVLQAGV